MENVYAKEHADESYETSATTEADVMPRGICKSVGGIRMPNRSSSTHSVRILSPTPVASPTPSIRGRHPPPTSPSLATLPLAEVAVSTISLSMKEPSIQLQQQQQQDDNQQQHKELPPTSKKLQGNSTNTSTTIPRKPKVDFVRFDSTEIHYTDHDEVRTKISDEIKRYWVHERVEVGKYGHKRKY